MSIEEVNKESIIRLTEEVFNKGDISILPVVIATDFVSYGNGESMIKGLDQFRQMVEMTLKSFPDFHYTIEDMFAAGDRLAVRYSSTGTFENEMMGIPPTGKKFNISSAYLCRMADGKQVETWGYSDQAALNKQLGISPPAAQG